MGGNSTPAKLPCESCAVFLWTQNRKAAIKLLRFGKQREIQPVVHTGIRERQHRYCYLPVNELFCNKRAQGLTRSHSWTADTHMVAGTLTMCGEPLEKRRMSCPPLIRHENFCQGIQPLTVSVMMQVELIPRKFLYVCKDVQESRPTRSKTCNKYSFLVQENSLYKARRNSAPTVVD